MIFTPINLDFFPVVIDDNFLELFNDVNRLHTRAEIK